MYDSKNIEVILNTDIPITIPNFKGGIETFHFSEINFNGNEYEESESIQENTMNFEKYGTLEKTEVFFDNNNNLVFRGELNPKKTLDNVKKSKCFYWVEKMKIFSISILLQKIILVL